MTLTRSIVLTLLLAASTSSQEKPKPTITNSAPIVAETHGILLITSGPPIQTLLTCDVADSDPESYFDCKIAPGHSLDEVMRVVARQMHSQSDSCQKDKDLILKGWKHSIDQFQKALKPIQHDEKGRS